MRLMMKDRFEHWISGACSVGDGDDNAGAGGAPDGGTPAADAGAATDDQAQVNDQGQDQQQQQSQQQQQQQSDWRAAIAGSDPARLEALKAYDNPEMLFARLNTDWRQQMAGEDKDALKFLEKYNDPSAAYKAWRSAVAKLSEGGRVKIPGADATPEEKAEWNKALGVAEAPDKYEITAKPDEKIAKEITEADKTMLSEITNKIHAAFASGPVKAGDLINLAHQIYYDGTLAQSEQVLQRGLELAQQAESENRAIWGDENYNKMIDYAIEGAKQFFPGQGPEGEAAFYEFMGQRLETGHALFDHPVIQRMFAQIGLRTVEDPMFLALQDGKTSFDIDKRIDEIRGMRNGTSAQRAEYARLSAPGGELGRLLDAREKRRAA